MNTLLDDQYYEDIKNLHHPLTKEDAFQLMLKGYSFVPKETLLDTSIYVSVYLHWEHESPKKTLMTLVQKSELTQEEARLVLALRKRMKKGWNALGINPDKVDQIIKAAQ